MQGPGLAAVGSALISSVVGTPRLIQFSLKYLFFCSEDFKKRDRQNTPS
jgi:hypothetical protein